MERKLHYGSKFPGNFIWFCVHLRQICSFFKQVVLGWLHGPLPSLHFLQTQGSNWNSMGYHIIILKMDYYFFSNKIFYMCWRVIRKKSACIAWHKMKIVFCKYEVSAFIYFSNSQPWNIQFRHSALFIFPAVWMRIIKKFSIHTTHTRFTSVGSKYRIRRVFSFFFSWNGLFCITRNI